MAPEAATEAAAEGKKFSLECINTKPFFRRGFQHFLEKKKGSFYDFFLSAEKSPWTKNIKLNSPLFYYFISLNFFLVHRLSIFKDSGRRLIYVPFFTF